MELDQSATVIVPLLRELHRRDEEFDFWEVTGPIESAVVPCGQLYSGALPTTEVLLAILAEGRVFGRSQIWDLLFWIVRGIPADGQNRDLGQRCRAVAREGLWLCYAELRTPAALDALAILNVVEPNRERFRWACDYCQRQQFTVDCREDFYIEDS